MDTKLNFSPYPISEQCLDYVYGMLYKESPCFEIFRGDDCDIKYCKNKVYNILKKKKEFKLYKWFDGNNSIVEFYKTETGPKTILRIREEESGFISLAIGGNDKKHVETIEAAFQPALLKEKTPRLHILRSSSAGSFYLSVHALPNLENIDIPLHYGEKFCEVNTEILNKLNMDNRSGLYLFHGLPGTGKSSYIKHLIAKVDKKFIYIPTSHISVLSDPAFSSILLEHKNAVLILEDAEKAIISRDSANGNGSLVSSLLNLSDGLLSSVYSVSIIVTFNVGRENIDEALLRKGRLKIEHKFEDLSISDAQNLVNSLKLNYKVEKTMTLAEIYHLEDKNFRQNQNVTTRIGF